MIKEKLKHKGITVDCSGPDGNAFQLLKTASDLGKRMGWTKKEIDNIRGRIKNGEKFEPKPMILCNWCYYWEECPAQSIPNPYIRN